jgi:hypothetical protein
MLSNTSFESVDYYSDDDTNSINDVNVFLDLNKYIIQRNLDMLKRASQISQNSVGSQYSLVSQNSVVSELRIQHLNNLSQILMNTRNGIFDKDYDTESKDNTAIAKDVSSVPTVGLFNILPPQLLRRSKGEVKISNTNLQKDSSNEPVEVLFSTITPIYNKKQSSIFPELFTVIDKIYDKVDHSTDINKLNVEILKLIEKVRDETNGLESKYIKPVES